MVYKELKTMKEVIHSLINTTVIFFSLLFHFILICGAIFSGALLLYALPEVFLKLWTYISPILLVIFLLIKICIFSLGLAIGIYLFLKLLLPYFEKLREKRKLKKEKLREEYLNKLADKMNKKLRRKK